MLAWFDRYLARPEFRALFNPQALEQEAQALAQFDEAVALGKRWRRWGAVMNTRPMKRRMMWVYVGMYGVGAALFWQYHQGDMERERAVSQLMERQGLWSEYDELRYKLLTARSMRTRDQARLEEYEAARKQWRGTGEFNPRPEEVPRANRYLYNLPGADAVVAPATDTTDFYNAKAEEFDKAIAWEERIAMIGRRRRWAMAHCRGDVLEVACGTGRNIAYTNVDAIRLLTFLDAARNMVEAAHTKFREKYPHFARVGFVEGRAESLGVALEVRYDTVVETFGVCSHEDPVAAVRNMGRLLKPGGRVVLVEHGRSYYDWVNRFLDTRAPQRAKEWGCRWNMDIGEVVDDLGLDVVAEKRFDFGTTWCFILKRKEDPLREEELGWVARLSGRQSD